jgi:hypothetical protein
LRECLAEVRVAVRNAHAARESRGLRVHKGGPTLPWGSTRRHSRGR